MSQVEINFCELTRKTSENINMITTKVSDWTSVLTQYFGYGYDLSYSSNVIFINKDDSTKNDVRFAIHSNPELMSSKYFAYDDAMFALSPDKKSNKIVNGLSPTVVIYDNADNLSSFSNTAYYCAMWYSINGIDFFRLNHAVSPFGDVYFLIPPMKFSKVSSLTMYFHYGMRKTGQSFIDTKYDNNQNNNYVYKVCNTYSYIQYGSYGVQESKILKNSFVNLRVYIDVFDGLSKSDVAPSEENNFTFTPREPHIPYYRNVALNDSVGTYIGIGIGLNPMTDVMMVPSATCTATFYVNDEVFAEVPLYVYANPLLERLTEQKNFNPRRMPTDGCFISMGNVYIPETISSFTIKLKYSTPNLPGQVINSYYYEEFGKVFLTSDAI